MALLTQQQTKLDLYTISWDNNVSFESLYSHDGNGMILVNCELGAVIALRFDNVSERYFDGLRQDFVSSYMRDHENYQQTNGANASTKAFNMIPLRYVEHLPAPEMWEGVTRWREDAIWASAFLRLSVCPTYKETGSMIELITMNGERLGTFTVAEGVRTREVHENVMDLWHALRITESCRINTNQKGTTAFYTPKPEDQMYKGRKENMQYFVTYKNKDKEEKRLLVHAPNSTVAMRYIWKADPQSVGCHINIRNCLAEVKSANIPAIKVEEARWKGKGFGEFYCSLCQGESETKSEFCPHCFAYME